MKTKIVILVMSTLFFLVSCEKEMEPMTDVSGTNEKSVDVNVGTLISETVHFSSLEGNLLNDPADRKVNVYLPKSYFECPGKKFPVIYFLHGNPAWGDMLIDPIPYEYFFQMAQLQARVDFPEEGFLNWINNLVDEEMKEAIIVMPDAKTRFGPCFYLNNEVQGNYEDYIVKELVSYIDSHYRTIAHFNWRAITGHCAGGYGALQLAMKHPDVFKYVGALSPSHFPQETVAFIAGMMPVEDEIWLNNYGVPPGPFPYDPYQPFKFANNSAFALAQAWLPNPDNTPYYCDFPIGVVDGQPVIYPELMAKWNEQNLLALALKYRIGLKQLKTVYFDCGTNDDLGMYLPNVMLHDELNEMHVRHEFETYSNPGTHISNLYERLGKMWTELSNDFPDYDN